MQENEDTAEKTIDDKPLDLSHLDDREVDEKEEEGSISDEDKKSKYFKRLSFGNTFFLVVFITTMVLGVEIKQLFLQPGSKFFFYSSI